jgi:hypothetical protein
MFSKKVFKNRALNAGTIFYLKNYYNFSIHINLVKIKFWAGRASKSERSDMFLLA